MWKQIVVTLIGVAGAGIVALIVAYMARRQSRQIELHRLDPSVPLKPPPNVVRVFVSKNSSRLYNGAALIWTIFMLYRNIHKEGPITRGDVAFISMDVAGIFCILLVTAFVEIVNLVYQTTAMHVDMTSRLMDKQVETNTCLKEIKSSD